MAEKEFTRAVGKGFGDINPMSGAPKTPGLKEIVELFDFGQKAAFRPARFVGPIEAVGLHKVKIKKKDGETIEIQKPCLAFDRKKGVLDSTKQKKCPYCQMGIQQYLAVRFFSNVIDRQAQEEAPKKIKPHTKSEIKKGFLDIDSEAFSPVKVLGMPSSLTKRIKEIDERNLRKDKSGKKKHYEIRDPDHGIDVELKFNKKEQAANMYSAVKADESEPLTKDERKLLLWDLSVIFPKEEYAQAKKEADSMATRMPDDVAKEMKKANKGKESSDSSGSGSDSGSEDSGKKSKKKSSKSDSDSGSGSDSKSGSDSDKDSSDSASDSSASDSDSGSDSASASGSDSSDGGKDKKGSKDKAKSSAQSSKSKKGSAKGKSADSDSDSASESVSASSASDKKSKSKKKASSASSASDSGSDLSGLDSDSSGSDSESDKKSKKKKK